MPWNSLETMQGLQAILSASSHRPQLIFKHSTRCGVSSGAKMRLDANMEALSAHFDLHYLDLLQHRDISNEIAQRLGVWHESPQVLIVIGGKSAYDESHDMISPQRLISALPKAS